MNYFKLKLHTIHILILLLLVLVLGSIGMGLLVQNNPVTLGIDNFFYELIHEGPHNRFLDILITPFNYNFLPYYLSPGSMPSYYYIMFLFTFVYLIIFDKPKLKWAFFTFILGTFLAQLVTTLDWHFVFRSRPFLHLPNTVDAIGRMAWEKLSSYPSGHARETTMYSTLIIYYIPKLKWPLIIFVIFIAWSRIYIGAHYPTDVLAGIFIGFITAQVSLLIAQELQSIFTKKKGDKKND